MNTSSKQQTLVGYSITVILAMYGVLASVSVQARQPDALSAQETWQKNRLLEPTTHQREQEQKGKVVIYDGLKDTTIDKAMDNAFDRIENMMFIRIIRTGKHGQPRHEKNGDVMVEDDGC